jgi:hypothetical protein
MVANDSIGLVLTVFAAILNSFHEPIHNQHGLSRATAEEKHQQ